MHIHIYIYIYIYTYIHIPGEALALRETTPRAGRLIA